jgi:hypothetical protein
MASIHADQTKARSSSSEPRMIEGSLIYSIKSAIINIISEQPIQLPQQFILVDFPPTKTL